MRLTADSDDVLYPKRFLLLGMMLFKDILPILAQDHKDSEFGLLEPQSSSPDSNSLYTYFYPLRLAPLGRQAFAVDFH